MSYSCERERTGIPNGSFSLIDCLAEREKEGSDLSGCRRKGDEGPKIKAQEPISFCRSCCCCCRCWTDVSVCVLSDSRAIIILRQSLKSERNEMNVGNEIEENVEGVNE